MIDTPRLGNRDEDGKKLGIRYSDSLKADNGNSLLTIPMSHTIHGSQCHREVFFLRNTIAEL